jgi:hypothetical protein
MLRIIRIQKEKRLKLLVSFIVHGALDEGYMYKVKRILTTPSGILSLRFHKHKS